MSGGTAVIWQEMQREKREAKLEERLRKIEARLKIDPMWLRTEAKDDRQS